MTKKLICLSIVFIMSFGVMQAQKSIIIKFKENNYTSYNGKYQSGNENFDNLINNSGHKHNPIGNFAKTKTLVVNLNPDDFLDFYINEYKKLENVDFVEEDFIAKGAGISNLESNSFNPISTFPNDTFFNRQWGLYNDGTMSGIGSVVADSDTDMELAWDIETGDPNMIIAVPDTGFRMTHPELAGRIWNNPNDPIDGIDNDGNGLIDDYQGWDYVNNDNDPTDDYGHGSNCSGIILAKANNGIGYAGVNWNSKLMVLKVLNQNNSGTYSAMANSIYYAVDNGAKVISMSIGGTTFSQALKDAVDYAYNHNVVFVACMMNDNNNAVYYPAGHDNVISVGSTNANDYRTNPFSWGGGSNYGNHIDVVAPGNYIYGLSHTSDTNYNTYWGGTSQATPLVAGIISLMLSKNPTLSVDQIRDIIRDSADDMVGNPAEDTAGFDIYMGYGRANAFKALQDVPVLNITETADISNIQITNPIKESLIIRSSKELGNTKIIIYSLEGKQIFETAANIKQGINETNLSNIPKGNYILEFNNKNYRKSFKIIKH